MDGEHAFSAALVLVMVNIAFASNLNDSSAMDTAMSVLQGMAEKGNSHIRSRYQLLKNLQSMIHSSLYSPPYASQSTNSAQPPSASSLHAEMTAPPTSTSPPQTQTSPFSTSAIAYFPSHPSQNSYAESQNTSPLTNPTYECTYSSATAYFPPPFDYTTLQQENSNENNNENNNDADDDPANLIPFEAYTNLDYMNMDFDWTLWTTEAARNGEV